MDHEIDEEDEIFLLELEQGVTVAAEPLEFRQRRCRK
jgi:hypothetical protein